MRGPGSVPGSVPGSGPGSVPVAWAMEMAASRLASLCLWCGGNSGS